ncbi:MAG: DUF255 domain-containing protein, partial [Verrucomicrobiales bacterium]|nr:DUF255 domain-containing protein [Verrucomicrobiales bacterium]
DLSRAGSPFDRSFADTAVWWRPWGEEAFAAAKQTDRPIFLFIGYSSCPWCSKMRRGSFSDPEVAGLINQNFIPVLVDAESLPGVNRLFMRYLEITRKQSGWPLCVWLTPDRLPITAGNYFPDTNDGSSPAFVTVLDHISGQWNRFPEHYRTQTRRDLGDLVESLQTLETSTDWTPSPAILNDAYSQLAATFDPVNGGFGSVPKFPAPLKLRFLLRYAERFPDASYQRDKATSMVTKSLDHLVSSSTHDLLAGGFFRYSQDASWNSPNFEKMLDTQALIARALIHASTATGDASYAATARRALRMVSTEFALPGGGYASAIAAESTAPGSVGTYYTWTPDEISEALGGDPSQIATATSYYSISRLGNLPIGSTPHGELSRRNTLYIKSPDQPTPPDIATIEASLLSFRDNRPAPRKDEKIILQWNALLASTFVAAATFFDDPTYLTRAADLVTFLLDKFTNPGAAGLARTLFAGQRGAAASSVDYAALIAAILDLHTASPSAGWLEKAVSLQQQMDQRFHDPEKGGYWDLAERKTLFYNLKTTIDGSRSSANSLAVRNLVDLAALTGNRNYLDRAATTLRSRYNTFRRAPDLAPSMNLGIMAFLDATPPSPR